MRPNILITSAGRRVSLVQGFQAVARHEARRVLAADARMARSAACQVADAAHHLPFASCPDFGSALLELCQREDIGLVVPTIDPELPVLAALRASFLAEGIEIVVSEPSFIAECADKRLTKQLFERLGVATPAVYSWPAVPGFPLFAKPYDGSGSVGARVVTSHIDAQLAIDGCDRLMLCDYFSPEDHDEFTIDCYYDRQSRLRCAVPRQRIEVRNGEVAQARTARNELVDEMFEHVGTLGGARGMVTIQAFVDRELRTTSYIEINARVGGGYPLSRVAGADYQQLLVDEYLNHVPPPIIDDWRDKAIMLRYDAEVVRFES